MRVINFAEADVNQLAEFWYIVKFSDELSFNIFDSGDR